MPLATTAAGAGPWDSACPTAAPTTGPIATFCGRNPIAPTAAPVAVPTVRGPALVTFSETQPSGAASAALTGDALPERRDLPLLLASPGDRLRRTQADRADQRGARRRPSSAVRGQRRPSQATDRGRETDGGAGRHARDPSLTCANDVSTRSGVRSVRTGILLAAAMFVFVIGASFTKVSISAVVHESARSRGASLHEGMHLR